MPDKGDLPLESHEVYKDETKLYNFMPNQCTKDFYDLPLTEKQRKELYNCVMKEYKKDPKKFIEQQKKDKEKLIKKISL